MIRQTPAANIAFGLRTRCPRATSRRFASPACNGGRQIPLRGGFENNRIDPARFSPAALNLVSSCPAPPIRAARLLSQDRDATKGSGGPRRFSVELQPFRLRPVHGDVREEPDPAREIGPGLSLYNTTRAAGIPGLDKLAQSVAVGDTLIFGPTTVNSLRSRSIRTSIARLARRCSIREAGLQGLHYDPVAMVLAVTAGSTSRPGGGRSRPIPRS